ncbi:MAG: lysine--tRNA ligase, partial [Pseudothermotoga sp.]|nr:lysine--tRNA ligase [Pseudothermotoga sp.]
MAQEIRNQKLQKIGEIREIKVNPYPYRFEKTHSSGQIREKFGYLNPAEVLENEKLSTAGRVMTIRLHGKSCFFTLKDFDGRIQAYIRQDAVGEKMYEFFKRYIDTGDIVGIRGFPFKSKTGELTIFVEEFQLLCKAVRPLPE